MPQEPLKQLHDELNKLDAENADMQSQVDALKAQVQQAISDSKHHETLVERLEEAFLVFETDHPRIASAIRKAIDVLSTSGI